jgi:hypothetical protein
MIFCFFNISPRWMWPAQHVGLGCIKPFASFIDSYSSPSKRYDLSNHAKCFPPLIIFLSPNSGILLPTICSVSSINDCSSIRLRDDHSNHPGPLAKSIVSSLSGNQLYLISGSKMSTVPIQLSRSGSLDLHSSGTLQKFNPLSTTQSVNNSLI